MKKQSKVLVTGSDGFLGKYIVKELEAWGYDVLGFDIKSDMDNDIRFSSFACLDGVDYVVHLAAHVGLVKCYHNPEEAARTNCVGTTRLLEACKRHGIKRFIYASTWAVEGKKVNPYDITKSFGEDIVNSYNRLHGLNTCVLRFGTAYGKHMRKHGVIQAFIERAKKREPLVINGRGEQIRQFTHAKDIARGVCLALQNYKVGTYYLVSEEEISIKELAEMFDSEIDYKPAREQDEDYQVINPIKTYEDFGWKAEIKLKDGIEDMKNG